MISRSLRLKLRVSVEPATHASKMAEEPPTDEPQAMAEEAPGEAEPSLEVRTVR